MKANPIVANVDLDDLHCAAVRLQSLLVATYGEGGESFRNMNDTLQDHFLWQCANMASEIANSLEAMLASKALARLEVKETCHG